MRPRTPATPTLPPESAHTPLHLPLHPLLSQAPQGLQAPAGHPSALPADSLSPRLVVTVCPSPPESSLWETSRTAAICGLCAFPSPRGKVRVRGFLLSSGRPLTYSPLPPCDPPVGVRVRARRPLREPAPRGPRRGRLPDLLPVGSGLRPATSLPCPPLPASAQVCRWPHTALSATGMPLKWKGGGVNSAKVPKGVQLQPQLRPTSYITLSKPFALLGRAFLPGRARGWGWPRGREGLSASAPASLQSWVSLRREQEVGESACRGDHILALVCQANLPKAWPPSAASANRPRTPGRTRKRCFCPGLRPPG